jgi:hypothetical protein
VGAQRVHPNKTSKELGAFFLSRNSSVWWSGSNSDSERIVDIGTTRRKQSIGGIFSQNSLQDEPTVVHRIVVLEAYVIG